MTHFAHSRTHGFVVRMVATFGTHHMMEEAAHVATYANSPVKAAAVALAALATHHFTHTASH